jgi:hypothetical protein
MLLMGYFEGIGAQRGIAWRCSDSRSLAEFLGVAADQATPDHSSLTRTHQRLPLEVHEQVFVFVLQIAEAKKLIDGKAVAADSTTLEANAAMKTIVRKDTGDDWKQYLRRLAQAEGMKNPSDEELCRFDKKRKNKKVSNDDWQSPSDPDSRIAKMKDGTTHLAYKAEHVVDLASDMVLEAKVHPADQGDPETLCDSVLEAQLKLQEAGSDAEIADVAADKGYHKAATLALCRALGLRTYIPEPERPHQCCWTDKPEEHREAVYANRRRVRGRRSKKLQRLRSEYTERSFAHVCETGGARRTWLRGLANVTKRYLIQVAARNLGVILRKLFGIGTPRGLQGFGGLVWSLYLAIQMCWDRWQRSLPTWLRAFAPLLDTVALPSTNKCAA